MNQAPRLGEPIELPWWVFVLCSLPALITLGALVWPSSWLVRAIGGLSSVAIIWITVRVAQRVESKNMQSVWLSAAYAVWVFFAVAWVTALIKHA